MAGWTRLKLTIALAATMVGTSASGQSASGDGAATADDVMAQLKSEAAVSHKKIFLMFGASWCGNCHLFDRFLADPAIHPIFSKVFVFADLATGENASDKRHSNIPGGAQLQAAVGGRNAGFPYMVILDEKGNPIIDSVAPKMPRGGGGNIGYPDSPSEIEWFMQMLKKGAPSLSTQERTTVHDWLSAHSTSR